MSSFKLRFCVAFLFGAGHTGVPLPAPYWWTSADCSNNYLQTGFSATYVYGTFAIPQKNPKFKNRPKIFTELRTIYYTLERLCMESILESLAQYGPLGLWTASLLWMNWQMRKEQKQSEKEAKEALAFHQENIAKALLEQRMMLQQGLDAMKEKYAEDRMLRIKGLNK